MTPCRGEIREASFRSSRERAGHIERSRVRSGTRGCPTFEAQIFRFQFSNLRVDASEGRLIHFRKRRRRVTFAVALMAGDFSHERDEVFLQRLEPISP